ncbi:bifunctional phosphoribosyl-AMP cyclohydrolase/phosphoribosyl-ATP diphosphatase HisIE [Kurthia sibirica]|uniref:Histidine biosynthesis bifunctional protein HisIE n=1 Tax=Kurthia sibirica TaxID=202750 RepID=A0A2U3AJB4_9BACL|nr:bifunctional phosphoribosyl-AMP cyclohydrolase/phosphoribosyl-ATP diphosphatase HisIE [Kurthia sibirica]PWI24618.1 bifunctional phosphoribosyl-AMP cyclohydrolase/phosphoribosyl-ATP pyrophosphatase [Kurthia sibirica]GEK33446.1 histidine biosynthesis bifunctional protein HisIE [Kurthia sibirica]
MTIKYDAQGLIPTIIQHAQTKEVLTLAYMNEEAYNKTCSTGETWLYSRSRQELWHKGATSGHTQQVMAIRLDCDADAIVLEVLPNGPACHTGATSCFHKEVLKKPSDLGSLDILDQLKQVIATREVELPKDAYTTYLFNEGIDKISKKVGEEATEVVIAAKNRDAEELKWEAADLIYHLLVLLQEQKLDLYDVLGVLQKRHDKH